MNDWIEILCHKCKCRRFQVIKPKRPFFVSDPYFWCSECINEDNNEYFKKQRQMPESLRYNDL